MPSRRTDIRQAFAAAITGLPQVGNHVFITRSRALSDTELPAIMVFSGESEAVDYDIDGSPTEERWRIRADIIFRNGDSNETLADEVLDSVRVAVRDAAALHDETTECRYIGTGEVDIDDSTQKAALRLPIMFEVVIL